MNTSPSFTIPWELIGNSFSGILTPEEEIILRQWIESDVNNKEKYEKLKQIWESGLDDYKLYLMADEKLAWNKLKDKLIKTDTKIIELNPGRNTRYIFRFAAVASIFIILISSALWFILSRNQTISYETAYNEKRNINLSDGTTIALNNATKIKLASGYNTKNRTVIMNTGEARFEIRHNSSLPFIVDLGDVNIKDIGTVFIVKKDNETIYVHVFSGKVVFGRQSSADYRELSANMSITYNIKNKYFSDINVNNPVQFEKNDSLSFNNTPLKEAVLIIQKKYNKIIKLEGNSIEDRKITAHLDGLDFESTMNIICKSLNLQYYLKDSIYIIKSQRDKQLP